MAMYKLTWEIEIEAENIIEAAIEAKKIQLDEESTATFFKVENLETGKKTEIHLNQI